MKITANEVATSCGVSPASVSRAFRANAPMSQPLRDRILSKASKLGYVPRGARKRGKQGRRAIAIVVGDIQNPFYSDMLERFA